MYKAIISVTLLCEDESGVVTDRIVAETIRKIAVYEDEHVEQLAANALNGALQGLVTGASNNDAEDDGA